jgi:uncharacterized protein YndB with AHSA1/START domain
VWEAIATGPGVNSWFMGRNTVEPGEGGATQMTIAGQTETSTITAWEPAKHLAFRSGEAPDGTFMAMDFLIEGRQGGSTTLRLVHSGILGGDNWESEYEAMKAGWPLYLHTLVAYLTHFPGRTATGVFAIRPGSPAPRSWEKIFAALGLPGGHASEGAPVRFTEPGGHLAEGVVDTVCMPHYLGVRTHDGLYRFIHGGADRGDAIVIGHHLFRDINPDEADRAWQQWLTDLLEP